ncbi:MAG: polyamine aminopropyltransferase [Deltaproteobacteria bacterium]|nr:polyamine aminopropyltransferase [Deltaproteobacteria bacterium]
MFSSKQESISLQIALFATGCAGIVAEFVLSTLATYLIGNTILQWTIVMSLMLFAMGVGSRISRFFKNNLLDSFILIEFLLSILCSISAIMSYGYANITVDVGLPIYDQSFYTSIVIYTQAFIIGALIGLEIPLVTRLNEEYDELRTNISNVMEKDYYGSLLGGILFAFVALPFLGLTYTPIVLGAVNFFVASLLILKFYKLLIKRKLIVFSFCLTLTLFITIIFSADFIIKSGEQSRYKDKIVYSKQTKFQKIVITKWKKYFWLFINGQEQFSTFDEIKYHEPLVHPAMMLSSNIENILILGGGDGLAVREILKHSHVKSIKMVDLDPVMTDLAKNHPVLKKVNQSSMHSNKITVINSDASLFLENNDEKFGVIIIDLPDPDTVDLMHVYSLKFYKKLKKRLIKGGVIVTQATSPFFSRKAFLCINKTFIKAGFKTLPYHNHIPTMGEWGWIISVRDEDYGKNLKKLISKINFNNLETRYINNDSIISMINFGKEDINDKDIKVNTEINPVLYKYYLEGSWGIY